MKAQVVQLRAVPAPAADPVGDLLLSGAVRIVGVWPRALDAHVVDGGRVLLVRARPRGWSCSCGELVCAHRLAVRRVTVLPEDCGEPDVPPGEGLGA